MQVRKEKKKPNRRKTNGNVAESMRKKQSVLRERRAESRADRQMGGGGQPQKGGDSVKIKVGFFIFLKIKVFASNV